MNSDHEQYLKHRTKDIRPKALDLLDSCYEDFMMRRDYFNAVAFCIVLSLAHPTRGGRSFEDDGFRDWCHQQVFAPLESNLEQNFDIDKEELART